MITFFCITAETASLHKIEHLRKGIKSSLSQTPILVRKLIIMKINLVANHPIKLGVKVIASWVY